MPDPSLTPDFRELPHLATFARAAERGSFTAAAADLGVSQAAVSQRIAALEKDLRTSLFDRRAGRIALTEAGERLYELARRILDLHEEARRSLGGLPGREQQGVGAGGAGEQVDRGLLQPRQRAHDAPPVVERGAGSRSIASSGRRCARGGGSLRP